MVKPPALLEHLTVMSVCVYIATEPGRLCSSRREGFGKSCENKFQHQLWNTEQPSSLQNAEGIGKQV